MSVLKYFKKTPVAPHRATGLKCNFFSKFAMRSLEKNKKRACRPPNGRQAPSFFFQGPHCEFEEKKIYT